MEKHILGEEMCEFSGQEKAIIQKVQRKQT